MRNQHPGTCYRCGKDVEAGAGHFEKAARFCLRELGAPLDGGASWLTQHATCAIKYRGTDFSRWNDPEGDSDELFERFPFVEEQALAAKEAERSGADRPFEKYPTPWHRIWPEIRGKTLYWSENRGMFLTKKEAKEKDYPLYGKTPDGEQTLDWGW